MNTKLSLLLARGKDYMQSLQGEQGRRVTSVLLVMLALTMFVISRWSSPTPVLMQQQEMLDQLSCEQQTNVNALAVRLAELQAASTRLDALGERLVSVGQLDSEEFNFNQPTPVGGPEMVINDGHSNILEMGQSISRLSQVLSSQFARLDALQLLLLDGNLEHERKPAGWPVSSG